MDEIAIVGGCGHVGLGLAIAFADRGASVAIFDIDDDAVACVSAGRLPFREPGAAEPLARVLAAGRLVVSTDASVVAGADTLVIEIGTRVATHLHSHSVAHSLSMTHV